jgi:phage terminase large subunit GpA-like protein
MAVAIVGFTTGGEGPGGRLFLIDYWRFDGDTEFVDDPRTWGALADTIENLTYEAPDGKRYHISLTLIDCGYRTDQVYRFVSQYESGVIAVKGREWTGKQTVLKHFAQIPAPMGTLAFGIMVDMYKDRLHATLAHEWNGYGIQPAGHFNAPIDCLDSQLKELTVETKREKIHAQTKQRIGFYWHRPSGSRNELWDLLVYALAGLDILAASIFPPDEKKGVFVVNWQAFWERAEQGAFYELR